MGDAAPAQTCKTCCSPRELDNQDTVFFVAGRPQLVVELDHLCEVNNLVPTPILGRLNLPRFAVGLFVVCSDQRRAAYASQEREKLGVVAVQKGLRSLHQQKGASGSCLPT